MPTETAEPLAHPGRAEIELGEVLHALSDPVRLQIVAALAGGTDEQTCGSFDVPVSKSTCTHHFRVLREAGVIHQRQEGTSRLNTLREEDLEALFPGLLETVLRSAGP
ncbi:MAG: ArsR/SmtB family transcription factor [Thermoleophilaceae bacterium]